MPNRAAGFLEARDLLGEIAQLVRGESSGCSAATLDALDRVPLERLDFGCVNVTLTYGMTRRLLELEKRLG